MHNPPSLWVTLNPDDIDDPIVQILSGVDISMENFDRLMCNKEERASRIAGDPFAAAKYFNLMINLFLKCLLGVEVQNGKVTSKKGIFGYVKSYFGLVETQGWGSLHLHILIWLEGAPSGDEMIEQLKSENFCKQVRIFIAVNI
jgi:hypothetical protein